jgi:hypothetical protein
MKYELIKESKEAILNSYKMPYLSETGLRYAQVF